MFDLQKHQLASTWTAYVYASYAFEV